MLLPRGTELKRQGHWAAGLPPCDSPGGLALHTRSSSKGTDWFRRCVKIGGEESLQPGRPPEAVQSGGSGGVGEGGAALMVWGTGQL